MSRWTLSHGRALESWSICLPLGWLLLRTLLRRHGISSTLFTCSRHILFAFTSMRVAYPHSKQCQEPTFGACCVRAEAVTSNKQFSNSCSCHTPSSLTVHRHTATPPWTPFSCDHVTSVLYSRYILYSAVTT